MKKITCLLGAVLVMVSASAQIDCSNTYTSTVSVTFEQVHERTLTGEFSVSEMEKVTFSPGNLYYRQSDGQWRFAEHQYDYTGEAYPNTQEWRDHFGYGTSGYNPGVSGKTAYRPDAEDGYPEHYLWTDIAGTNSDWGVYNAILNGGNVAGQWRTLTRTEWNYMFRTRTNAADKVALAQVNGVFGLVLLPDEFVFPGSWPSSNWVTTKTSYQTWNSSTNTFTVAQWTDMENNGAVFLPAAGGYSTVGNCSMAGITDPTSNSAAGSYWTSTVNSSRGTFETHDTSCGSGSYYDSSCRCYRDYISKADYNGWCVKFPEDAANSVAVGEGSVCGHRCVRLVKDVTGD
ncbi:MAG: hypothetical protein IJS13_07660 [Paludibacteraceae bacterium]|nr:hypothetical protein [Paludibacteraceae bacterium]